MSDSIKVHCIEVEGDYAQVQVENEQVLLEVVEREHVSQVCLNKKKAIRLANLIAHLAEDVQ